MKSAEKLKEFIHRGTTKELRSCPYIDALITAYIMIADARAELITAPAASADSASPSIERVKSTKPT